MRALVFGALVALLSVGAEAQRANPILAPDQRWGFHGFTLLPPGGEDWYSLAKSRTRATFGRRIESQTRTLVAAVQSERLARPIESPEALVAHLKARRARELDPGRLRLLAVDEARADLDGAWCTRYRLDAEERAGEGRVLEVRVEGRSCVHPASPDLLVDVSVSTRGPAGEQDGADAAQVAKFLDGLRFTPIGPSAGLIDAQDLIRRGAAAEGARLLQALADRGDSGAALRAARLYEGGQGIAADAARAERMYRLAAAAGEVDALYNLGSFYDKARGGARDAKEAVRWFLRAADQRDGQAQLNLGILFYRGDGVPVDHAQARAWLELAADNGSTRARDLLGTLEFRPDPWYGLPVRPTVLIDPP